MPLRNVLVKIVYSIAQKVHVYECLVCHRLYILPGRAQYCCPNDENYWGYGLRAKPPYKCPICGKTYEPPETSTTETAKQYAAFRAFTCCERPENKDLRKQGYGQATHRGKLIQLSTTVIVKEDGYPYGGPPFETIPNYRLITYPLASTRGDTCPECHGTGRVNGVHCDRCGGTGKLLV